MEGMVMEGKKVSIPKNLDWYLEQGISIIPLEPQTDSKKPRIKFKDRTEKSTREEIAKWSKETERWAIVCGEVSGNLVVIDVDREELFPGLNLGILAGNTYTEEKKGKYHIFLRTTKPLKHKQFKFGDKEDISVRFDNDLIIAGGTEHPSGGSYRHFITSPKEIVVKDAGIFDDLERLWRDYCGIVEEGKKSFAGFKKGVSLKTNILEVIKACTDLEELKDNGETYTCRCPLPNHKDITPSFVIYKKSNSYYCFGCNRGGNIIGFVKNFYGISAKEAIKKLKDEGAIEEKKKEFDLLEVCETTLREAQNPKYHGTINFESDVGIFFTVPIEPLSLINQPVFFTAGEVFAHKIEEGKHIKQMNGDTAHPQQMNDIFAQFYREFEGVPLYFSSNQRVQILEAFVAQCKGDKNVCRFDREEIDRLPAILESLYFKYNNNIEPYLLACWSIGTYLFPMFSVFPYLIFVGEKGTNKSGHLIFLSKICWNPVKLANPTEAALFRMSHQAKPTQLIDEVHRLLNNPLYAPLLTSLLESGHENGGFVPRVDKNDPNKIELLDVYCPKALATRESLELEEKGISVIITKNYDKKYAIARKNLETDTKLGNIQNTLLFYALSKWKEVLGVYNNIEPTKKISGRYFLLWAPILAICKVTYPEKYDELLTYAGQSVIGIEKKSYEIEIQVLSYLATHLTDIESNGSSILLKPIREALNVKWQPIFSALRNLGLIKKSRDTPHGKKFYLRGDKLSDLIKERNIEVEEFGETNICDHCGKEAFTTEYEDMLLCEDCIAIAEKDKNEEQSRLNNIGEKVVEDNPKKKEKPTREVNIKDLDEDGNVIKKPKPEAPSEEKIKSDIESAKRSLEESGLRESRDKEDSDSDEDNEKAVIGGDKQ